MTGATDGIHASCSNCPDLSVHSTYNNITGRRVVMTSVVIIQEVISWYAGCIVLFAVSSEETSDEPGERPHKRKRGHDNKLVTRVCSNTCVLLIR